MFCLLLKTDCSCRSYEALPVLVLRANALQRDTSGTDMPGELRADPPAEPRDAQGGGWGPQGTGRVKWPHLSTKFPIIVLFISLH